jgi:hypothetical protein
MFAPSSRYAGLPVLFWEAPDGRSIAYVSRRFSPPSGALPLLVEVTTMAGERLDQIASQTLGDPEQFWRICDANDAMNPNALVAEPGRRLRVPVPAPRGLEASGLLPLSEPRALGGAASSVLGGEGDS